MDACPRPDRPEEQQLGSHRYGVAQGGFWGRLSSFSRKTATNGGNTTGKRAISAPKGRTKKTIPVCIYLSSTSG
jgi:hypothetical protein